MYPQVVVAIDGRAGESIQAKQPQLGAAAARVAFHHPIDKHQQRQVGRLRQSDAAGVDNGGTRPHHFSVAEIERKDLAVHQRVVEADRPRRLLAGVAVDAEKQLITAAELFF